MKTKTCKRKPVVSQAKVKNALAEFVQRYHGENWEFWVKTVTDYLNGRLSTKQFKNVDVPESESWLDPWFDQPQ